VSDTANPLTTGISRTCIYTAAGRAIGAREPDPSVRNPDYLAEKLLGDPAAFNIDQAAVKALGRSYDEAIKDVEVVSTVRMMLVRTRFIDEALERAVAGGATHVVILGAGFDSHAYRCQDVLANVRVFEVDRPATQAMRSAHRRRISPMCRSTFSTRTSATFCGGTVTINRNEPSSSWKV
jgi:methyltransferase (TIGR00027 family)